MAYKGGLSFNLDDVIVRKKSSDQGIRRCGKGYGQLQYWSSGQQRTTTKSLISGRGVNVRLTDILEKQLKETKKLNPFI